jgi:hypothetical protein
MRRYHDGVGEKLRRTRSRETEAGSDVRRPLLECCRVRYAGKCDSDVARERGGRLPTHRSLPAGALAVLAPWPAARPALAFLKLLLGPANAALSGHLLLGILNPADELVAGQRRDVLPGIECRGVGDQRIAQVCRKLVHHSTGRSLATHRAKVTDPAVGRDRANVVWHGTGELRRARA